ncbi:MHC class I polypeptide-related sequence B-like isoform X2 [Diceros bicornis minor]|uniref:MHC class I polypeptide-related sequence B-like isoform X2 n=1 Tax=Diceros bicornis minor TaxID=77932 RepID=UPI0026F0E92F|nr:MHC class I polypeptide-related sequence B-like isoform X2 [Diceros bicornis minor]XP_058410791.1 MHC class I polypeptide-related sequence B-like isoform X2 [Diceros bicornis minor]
MSPDLPAKPRLGLCKPLPWVFQFLFRTQQWRHGSSRERRPYAWSHSLRYNLTVVFHNRSVQSRLFAEGHLDGQPCLHYDSEKGKAEPKGLCAETVLGAETWDTETKDLTEKGKDLRRTLADIMALQDQKGGENGKRAQVIRSLFQERLGQTAGTCAFPRDLDGGGGEDRGLWSSAQRWPLLSQHRKPWRREGRAPWLEFLTWSGKVEGHREWRSHCWVGADFHSLQEIWGCEIQADNHARGLRHFYYDGKLFLSYNSTTCGWTVPQSSAKTVAMEIKKSWDADGFQSKDYWAQVQGELCGRLQRYVESWMGFMERTVPPAVNVTCSQAAEGVVNVTCWAFRFSPRNISVTWLRDKKPLNQHVQQSGGVLPDRNGTYQTWVAIRIPQGEEQRFTCYVEHSGNHSTYPVPLGKALVHQSGWPAILGVAVVGVISSITLFALWYKKKKKTTSAAESPELLSLQHLGHRQMPPTDLNDTSQLGFQSLLSAPESIDSTEGAQSLQPGGLNSAPCSGLTSTFPLGASVSSSVKWGK